MSLVRIDCGENIVRITGQVYHFSIDWEFMRQDISDRQEVILPVLIEAEYAKSYRSRNNSTGVHPRILHVFLVIVIRCEQECFVPFE